VKANGLKWYANVTIKHLCFKLQNYLFAMHSNEILVAMQTVHKN